MAQTTRTLNPLPFQDLEPRRFEDLVRQLAYDFKPWRRLEATGRSGGDGSFDARGYEIVPSVETEIWERNQDDDDAEVPTAQSDRLWLIQCKRERAIGPTKLKQYFDEIPVETRSELHGMIFAAACDFSKATRDSLRDWAREHGVSEAHMWGKGELEDQLYQPKNDNLLFAYFGISLQIRKRSVRTALRSRLAMKKRAETAFGTQSHSCILLRDPTDDRYPFTGNTAEHFRGRWRVVHFGRLDALGISYQHKRHYAYIDDQQKGWDIVDSIDISVPSRHENTWADPGQRGGDRDFAWHFWNDIPESNRANFYEEWLIRYEDIYAIDDAGDEWAKFPHVYVDWNRPLQIMRRLVSLNRLIPEIHNPDAQDRVKFFPDTFPEPSPSGPKNFGPIKD
jgi:hypothetical protein